MNLPAVLDIQRIVELARVESVLRAVVEARRQAHQEISQNHILSGLSPVECRGPQGIDPTQISQPLLINSSAKRDLVFSFDPADIVEDRRHRSFVWGAGRGCAAAN